MTLSTFLSALRRWWYLPALTALLGGAVGLGLAVLATPAYTSSTTVYVSPGFADSATDLNQSSAYALSQMPSYAALATSGAVLQSTIDALGLDQSVKEVRRSISVTVPADTTTLEISVTSSRKIEAASVADSVARRTSDQIESLTPQITSSQVSPPMSSGEQLRPLVASIISPASVPASPSSPNTRVNVAEGVLIGLILGGLLVVVRQKGSTGRT